jgi:hypothetical protein
MDNKVIKERVEEEENMMSSASLSNKGNNLKIIT